MSPSADKVAIPVGVKISSARRRSVTGRVLARAGEADQGAVTSVIDVEASWAQAEEAARRWAGMFRCFLDENLG